MYLLDDITKYIIFDGFDYDVEGLGKHEEVQETSKLIAFAHPKQDMSNFH